MSTIKRSTAVILALAALMIGVPRMTSAGAGDACVAGSGSDSLECGAGSSTGTANDATAIGNSATATLNTSTAIGQNAEAGDFGTLALGAWADALGSRATAVGHGSNAATTRSLAVGAFAQATGSEATAVGNGAGSAYAPRASGARSIAIGGGSSGNAGPEASATNAIAIGSATYPRTSAVASGARSTAIGTGSTAGGQDSVAIGTDAVTSESGQVVLQDVEIFNINGDGRLGLGTATVDAPLDIVASVDTIGTGNAVFKIANPAGPTAFQLDPSDDGTFWNISATADNNAFRFSRSGTGAVEMELDSSGNMTLRGSLTTAGPRCTGGCDAVFDDDYPLASIEAHSAAMWALGYLPAVGPTTPGAPIDVAEMIGTLLNELETAHIYIEQLDARVKDQDRRLAALEALVNSRD